VTGKILSAKEGRGRGARIFAGGEGS